MNRELVVDILKSNINTKGYGFQIETVRIASSANPPRKIAQVPITFVERTAGQSKMNRKIVVEAWKMTTIWGLKRILKRR
jgi:dolichol-phosphate mannosyltransferase